MHWSFIGTLTYVEYCYFLRISLVFMDGLFIVVVAIIIVVVIFDEDSSNFGGFGSLLIKTSASAIINIFFSTYTSLAVNIKSVCFCSHTVMAVSPDTDTVSVITV